MGEAKYIVITPAYNEEQYIRKTLESMVRQQLLPAQWVVVDDNSSDATAAIVEEYQRKYSWITLVRKQTKESREVGAKVVRTFYYGLEKINERDYDFLVKLDADIELPPDYFNQIAQEFKKDKTLGICSGYCTVLKNDQWVEEKIAYYHTRGPIKSYRKACFEDIGGIKEVMGWDGIDDMTAMSKGWKTRQLRLPVKHFRPTGHASDPKKLRLRQGRAYYQRGYGPILIVIRTLSKIYRTGSKYEWYLLQGFFEAWKTGLPKYVDPEVERFTRNFQYKRIFKLKY
jgi:glycosyltransferase involved in cell wall biosynthesis